MSRLSRRSFLKLAGASAATIALYDLGLKGDLFHLLAENEWGNRSTSEPIQQRWAPTVCRVCPAGCGILVRMVGERAVKIEGNPRHPLNQGKICPRAQAALQVLYDPDRLRVPKLQAARERGSGRWQDITWDEALTQVADHLKKLEGLPHTLLFLHDAPPGHMRDLIQRFCQGYGSPNAVATDGLDAERLAHRLTQGWFDLAAHDWENTAYVLFFGGSFLEDWQPQVHMLRAYSYLRRGRPDHRARIVQVSPRFSVSAAKADEWVPLLPGRQGALALGMAQVIVRERLYDRAFVTNHCEGLDEFAALLNERYTPETVAGLTGVPAETIKRLAREFAALHRPAVAVAGRGLGEGTNAVFDHVAIHALNALVGSVDAPGGTLRPRRLPFTDWDPALPDVEHPRLDGAGTPTYPLAVNAPRTLPERILTDDANIPQILFLYEVNPLFEGPDAARWRDALARIPFIVSFSSFEDETTRYADLVLPNHTFLEQWVDGIPPGGMGRPILGLGRPAVDPLYDTRHTGDVLLSLAQAVGGSLAEALPWADYESLLRFRLRGLYEAGEGTIRADSFDEFWTLLEGWGVWTGDRYTYGQWDEVLTTPSGRFQFRLDQLKEVLDASTNNLGLTVQGDAQTLPHYEPPRFAGDEAEYPFHLVPYRLMADAGCRAPNAPLLWELYGLHLKEMWQNWVEINPETAHDLDIADGDQVWVESPQGRIQLKARVYEGVMPDAVNIPVGGGHTAGGRWAERVGGGNVAELVAPQVDPLAGTVAWCGTRVKIYK